MSALVVATVIASSEQRVEVKAEAASIILFLLFLRLLLGFLHYKFGLSKHQVVEMVLSSWRVVAPAEVRTEAL